MLSSARLAGDVSFFVRLGRWVTFVPSVSTHPLGNCMKQRITAGYWCFGIVASFLMQASLAQSVAPSAHPIVLKAAHLFDSVSGKLIDHGVIVVSASKIQAV